jgi:hypothetical protein
MIWTKSSNEGKPVAFGQIFDAVAEGVPVGWKVGGLSLFLSQDDQLYGGPWLYGTWVEQQGCLDQCCETGIK